MEEDTDRNRREAIKTIGGATVAARTGVPETSVSSAAETGTEAGERWLAYGGGYPETGITVLPPLLRVRDQSISY